MGSDTNAAFLELLSLRGQVGMLRKEIEVLRKAPKSKGTQPERDPQLPKEIAGQRLAHAADNLQRATAKFEAGMLTGIELKKAQAEWDISQAEAVGDTARALAIRVEFAEARFSEAEKKFSTGLISSEEHGKVKLERDLAIAELNGDKLMAACLKFEAAEERLKNIRRKQESGLESSEIAARAQLERNAAEAEYKAVQKSASSSK
jgi:hypothetical protein